MLYIKYNHAIGNIDFISDDAVCYSEGLEDALTDNRMVKKLITDAAENGFKGFYYL